ncbi:SAM-dependent chlorinase/fluorinase [bacterium]|nr:SAM-dependent chlorinase/fluorinase [bacterium]
MKCAAETSSIITLTTDFGIQGPFVGSMKGAILQINPDVKIIDISHQINPFDLFDAAFLVSCAYGYFPEGTVHCIVVDPGVGSDRRPVLAISKKYMFVAPDNGVLSYIYEKEAIDEVIHIKESRYFLDQVSRTFHGRDIFAPVSAWLARGIDPDDLGPRIMDYARLHLPKAFASKDGKRIYAQVIHIDIFGNLLTNIGHDLFESCRERNISKFRLRFGDICIERLCQAYTDLKKGETGAIFGSQGFLELFASEDSLAKRHCIKKGMRVDVVFE